MSPISIFETYESLLRPSKVYHRGFKVYVVLVLFQACLYKDPERWSFTFQSFVLLTLLRHHTSTQVSSV